MILYEKATRLGIAKRGKRNEMQRAIWDDDQRRVPFDLACRFDENVVKSRRHRRKLVPARHVLRRFAKPVDELLELRRRDRNATQLEAARADDKDQELLRKDGVAEDNAAGGKPALKRAQRSRS